MVVMSVKTFLSSFIFFIVMDLFWLGFVMRDFNVSMLMDIGNIEDGQFKIRYLPAIMAYTLMSLSVLLFLWPQIRHMNSRAMIFFKGTLMGLIIYGIFDMTNLAILKKYPIPFVVADILWGMFLFGVASVFVTYLEKNIFNKPTV